MPCSYGYIDALFVILPFLLSMGVSFWVNVYRKHFALWLIEEFLMMLMFKLW